MPTESEIMQVLSPVVDPELQYTIVAVGMARNIPVHEEQVEIELALTTADCPLAQKISDDAHEMSVSLLDTAVYRLASEHVCRGSCVVPAAVLKALEVGAGIFQAAESQIEFVGSVQQ